jgi:hypothetical protein
MTARSNVIPFPGHASRAPTVRSGVGLEPPGPALESGPSWADVGLMATILTVCLVPLVGLATGTLQFGPGELGLGAAGTFFSGRELVAELRELRRRS